MPSYHAKTSYNQPVTGIKSHLCSVLLKNVLMNGFWGRTKIKNPFLQINDFSMRFKIKDIC